MKWAKFGSRTSSSAYSSHINEADGVVADQRNIYDPLGLPAPFTMRAKILSRKL
jgi:hypothetical protein